MEVNTKETDESAPLMTKRQKVIKTVFLVVVWVCLGLYLEITGPTLIDLKIKTGADYEQVAVAVSGRSVGYFIGSAIGGVIVDKWVKHCDLMIGVCLTGGAIATVIVPWCRVLDLLWFVIVVQGTFEGVINIAGQKLILLLWEEDAASPLHILHGGFGIGSFIIPLISNPFLAIPKPQDSNNTGVNNGASVGNTTVATGGTNTTVTTPPVTLATTLGGASTPAGGGVSMTTRVATAATGLTSSQAFTSSSVMNTTTSWINGTTGSTVGGATLSGGVSNGVTPTAGAIEYLKETRIEYAYLISAIITLLVSVVFYVYQWKGIKLGEEGSPKKREGDNPDSKVVQFLKKCKKMIHPGTCTHGRPVYGVELFFVLSLYYFNILGGERILGKFVRVYAIEQLGFSVHGGSYMNTVFWIAFSIGRISGFIAARYIPIRRLILIETGGVFVSSILLNIFAIDSSLALWILMPTMAVFHAPCFPSGIGWADFHLEMTGMAITLLLLGGSVGGVVYLKISGYLFETQGPRSFMYHLLAYGITTFLLAIIMDLIGLQHGNRFLEEKKEKEKERMESADDINTQDDIDRAKTYKRKSMIRYSITSM